MPGGIKVQFVSMKRKLTASKQKLSLKKDPKCQGTKIGKSSKRKKHS